MATEVRGGSNCRVRQAGFLYHMMPESTNRSEIRTAPCATCIVCGSEGEFLYGKQQDRIFGTPGEWSLKRCSNRQCVLMWLDPMPLEEDIGKAYANYYTHSARDSGSEKSALKRIYLAIKREYIAEKFNYRIGPASFPIPWIGKLLYLFPLRRADADEEVRFLRSVPSGRLLDVGCGSGEWLVSMRNLGWDVTGVDSDEDAVYVGRQSGLNVHCGALEQQRLPISSFDAITLQHVIEHVIDPLRTLRECARLLKPDGILVVATPNGSSLGQRIYKENWRGLEPPRHLHVFSPQSMRNLLARAEFKRISVLPQVAPSIIYESHLLRRGWQGSFVGARRRRATWSYAWLFTMMELVMAKWKPSVADCLVGIAGK